MKIEQRDLGNSAEASSGGGSRGVLRETSVLVVGVIALMTVVYFSVGFFVELILPTISMQREKDWFAGWSAEEDFILSAEPDKLRVAFAREVLDRLLEQDEAPPITFQLLVIDDADPNAFAVPGGRILVTTGLLEILGDDEIALAFVLGHELGHFEGRDHLRGIGRSIGRGLVMSLIFGGGGDVIAVRTDQLLEAGHSRGQESAADQFGLQLVMSAYGSTEGSERLFQWLADQQQDPDWLSMIESHPRADDRLENLRRWAAEIDAE